MDALRELAASHGPALSAVGGLVIGLIFGMLVFRTNFCAMGAISDILSFGDYKRFRAWLLAGAVAILGVQVLQWIGALEVERAMYLSANLNWLGNVLGGLMFGFGMVFAGGCASRNLVRLGGGDLRSLVVLMVIGLFAYMTIGGLIGPLRSEIQLATQVELSAFRLQTQSMGDMLSRIAETDRTSANRMVAAVLALAILAYCLADKSFRTSRDHLLAGIGIGLCIVAGWAVTGLAFDEFADRPRNPISLTYVRPTGDLMEYLRRFTADMVPGFGVTTVIGALAGAFIAAKATGKYRVTTFADNRDTLRNLFGAALMGVGGVLALGCTIGQAVTGLSTLALGSLLAFVAIVLGGIAGIKALIRIELAGMD